MAMTAKTRTVAPRGNPKPRVAPPTPARTLLAEYKATAEEIGIDLMPWQETAARYITAQGQGDRWLYREVAIVVARQNGKTQLLIPLIVSRLRAGKRIMHTAQDRTLPREVFDQVADIMVGKFRRELAGKVRLANGQESIRTTNGGRYRIVAPTRGGARGPSNDLVIVDELREMDDFAFIAAAKPTLTVSKSPQMIYLSNAGTEDSVVLNALRQRAQTDPVLGYLEWSAAPGRPANDPVGWCESNPAIGYERGEMGSVLETLETEYRTAMLEGTMGNFETEHLCRWVTTLREQLVDAYSWVRCKADELPKPTRASIATSMDPKGKRASIAIAWREGDGVALRLLLNVEGDPVDTDALGEQVKKLAIGKAQVGFDPLTDRELMKYVKKPKAISGTEFANASAQFVNIVNAGKLRWADADPVTDDLTWTSRKPDGEAGSYHAVRAQDDRPITASLAAIRAVWLASGPQPVSPRVM